jgi:hypothetical protein
MIRALWMIVLTAWVGCGSQDNSRKPPRADADGERDAAIDGSTADASSEGGTAELAALVRDAVANWDSALQASCQCLAASGAFASFDECVAPSASGPTWVPCGTMALAAMDSPETRVIARCLRDELRTRADCLSRTPCDSPEHAHCDDGAGAAMCASSDPQILLAVLQACPDLGLLSRL